VDKEKMSFFYWESKADSSAVQRVVHRYTDWSSSIFFLNPMCLSKLWRRKCFDPRVKNHETDGKNCVLKIFTIFTLPLTISRSSDHGGQSNSTHRRDDAYIHLFYRYETKRIGKVFTDGKVIIQCDMSEWCVRVWTGLNWFQRNIPRQVFVITVIKLRVSWKQGIYWATEELLKVSKSNCITELIT
jgi:hypothetical protein